MTYTIKLFQEDGQWIANLVERNLFAQGDTLHDALAALSLLIESRDMLEGAKDTVH